jgi:large subunit ribosomal protein L10
MDRVTKEAQVSELKDKLGRVSSIVLADYRGLDVPTVTGLRDEFRKVQCEYKVFKNTLVKLAIKGTALEGMSQYLEGPTAMILSYESPSAPAKVATTFAKTQEKFVLKGGYFDGTVLDVKGLESLATMPGKDELRAKLLATFQAPATDLVRTLSAGAQNFMYLLSAKERAAGGEATK